jgi:hypothetical protein
LLIKSKRLNPIPFDDLKKMGVTPDEREDYLEVTQVNHNETPVQELEKEKDEQEIHTEKNLDEQEAEFKKETNQKHDSLSEIEEKRLRRKIEVEKSIEAFEESQAEKLRKKEFLAQVDKIKEASMSQLEIMREREKKYRVELEQALKENKDTSKISENYIKDQQALLYNNDSMGMYLSMSINDAMQNSTLDVEGNPNMSVKDHIFGRTAYGRQKSVLINGKPVMLDESVANAIQAERSPVLAGHLVDKDNDLSQNKEANFLVNSSQTKNITKELADYKIAFDDMINGLDKDRTEMTNIIKDAYPVADKLKYAYDDGMTYGSKEERNLDLRPRRALPKAALMWGIMYEQELLAYGRRLPKVNDNMVLAMHQYDDVYSY